MINKHLADPTMGSSHYQLGEKIRLLEASQRRWGKVGCIAIGSSMVDHGFDPEQFTRSYQDASGQEIKCFNFALNAIPASANGALAKILVDKYQPELLIYGTDARDYAVSMDAEETVAFFDSPWVRYHLGEFNFEGFMLEHSQFYRYSTQLKQLMRFDYERALRQDSRSTSLGYDADFESATDVDMPPPADDSYQYRYMTGLLSDYQMRTENLAGLERILKLESNGTKVVLVEMPVAGGYFYYFGNGKDDYEQFLSQISGLAERYDVPFIHSTLSAPIPNDGWRDYVHLNDRGAKALSSWLGEQIGTLQLTLQDDHSNP